MAGERGAGVYGICRSMGCQESVKCGEWLEVQTVASFGVRCGDVACGRSKCRVWGVECTGAGVVEMGTMRSGVEWVGRMGV